MNQRMPHYAFFDGKVVPIEDARISVMTHAFNYGTGVFGGLRGYWNEDAGQLYVFRPLDHFKRLTASARLLRMELAYSPEELVGILQELLRAENYQENCYVRPLVYKSQEIIGVRLHDISESFTMFAVPFGRYISNEEGAHVCFSSWHRVEDNALPARGKIAGAYVNSALIKTDAMLAGYDDALVLNSDGHISEMSAANLFIVRDGVAITPPINANILEGIVRRSVIHMLHDDLGVEVVERDIDRTEIYLADEAFMCGTGVQLAAISKVEHRPIGSGKMGPITTQVRDLYFDVVHGRVDKYGHWVTPMYATESVRA